MTDKDVLTALLVLSPLFLVFGLFVLVLVLRSRHNATHSTSSEPERGPWPKRLSTGPWYGQLASYFPPYYSPTLMIAVAVLFVADIVIQMTPVSVPASWLYLGPSALGALAVGHAWAFLLDFLRNRWSKAEPGDEAQPVAYYTPDMAPASYQPTFRPLSSLIRVTPYAIGLLGILLAFQIAGNPTPTWAKLARAADVFGLIGFWLGCREIQRGVKVARS